MMTGTEGPAECGTGLTIGHEGIGKEERCLSSKPVSNLTSLTHETILHLNRVVYRTAVADNRVLADHACTYEYRRVHRTHHCTLRQPCRTANLTVALDDGIGNILGIHDLHVVADIAPVGTRHAQFIFNHLLDGLLQLLVAIVFHHKCGNLTIQFTEDGHITISHLVKNGNHGAFAVCSVIGGLEGTYIGYVTVVADGVVVDIVAYLLYQTVVAHRDVTEGGVIDA